MENIFQSLENEIWKTIPGFNDAYQISSMGRLRKWLRNPRNKKPRWRLLNPSKDYDGYRQYTLLYQGEKLTGKIHRLMMIVFNPIENPEKYVVNHKNSIKDDNRLENLEWCTNRENLNHYYQSDNFKNRKSYRDTTLTDENVRDILEKYKAGRTIRSISKEYSVSDFMIRQIVRGKTWRHITSSDKKERFDSLIYEIGKILNMSVMYEKIQFIEEIQKLIQDVKLKTEG